MNFSLFFLLAGAYLIGSIPSGFLIAWLRGVPDIRKVGSGNIGATNVARVLGAPYFLLVFSADFCKAFVYLWLVAHAQLPGWVLYASAFALFLGNTNSIFLGLRGGKGVATLCGIVALVCPLVILPAACIFGTVLVATRTVGMASVATVGAVPLLCWWVQGGIDGLCVVLCVMCGISIFVHRKNVRHYFFTAQKQ